MLSFEKALQYPIWPPWTRLHACLRLLLARLLLRGRCEAAAAAAVGKGSPSGSDTEFDSDETSASACSGGGASGAGAERREQVNHHNTANALLIADRPRKDISAGKA